MKNQIRNFVLGAGLAALLCGPSLMAQTQETAEIPFDFHVGKSSLPAGTYSVAKQTFANGLLLRNDDTNNSILLQAVVREEGKTNPRLTFRCYDGDCFLSAIWIPGTAGYLMAKTSREKEVEKGGARLAMSYVPLATR